VFGLGFKRLLRSAIMTLSDTPDPDRLLDERQTAELLNLSVRTLQAWRQQGVGPHFVRAGRAVRYRRRDLIDWMESCTRDSTARIGVRGHSPFLNTGIG
jgi:predicted DNA-binding transcriptional regulator AlpA